MLLQLVVRARLPILLDVVDVGHSDAARAVEQPLLVRVAVVDQARAEQHVVEDVVVALAGGRGRDDAALLEEERLHLRALQLPPLVEAHRHVPTRKGHRARGWRAVGAALRRARQLRRRHCRRRRLHRRRRRRQQAAGRNVRGVRGACGARRAGAAHLPKRDELLLRTVLALPVASRIGLDWRMRVERSACSAEEARHTR